MDMKWVSVEDELPGAHGRAYWVYNHFGGHEAWYINDMWFLRHNMAPLEKVTHWMPLPEPPEEGE